MWEGGGGEEIGADKFASTGLTGKAQGMRSFKGVPQGNGLTPFYLIISKSLVADK